MTTYLGVQDVHVIAERIQARQVVCDAAGCDLPAVHIAQANGSSTPTKVWYGCDVHAAVKQ